MLELINKIPESVLLSQVIFLGLFNIIIWGALSLAVIKKAYIKRMEESEEDQTYY